VPVHCIRRIIQDGCTEPCTYCIVSVIRNKLYSKPFEHIIEEIQWARRNGFNEIVLVGANIGLYGMDIGSSLGGLFDKLQSLNNLPRIRVSSIEPRFITGDLINAMRSLPLCRHFHIPIQSGDDNVLVHMGRAYTNNDLRKCIGALSAAFPGAAIGLDVIVGFPYEDEASFMVTRQLIDDLPITHIHVFRYSPRPRTRAYALGDPIADSEKRARLRDLKLMVSKKYLGFCQQLVGQTAEVIIVQTEPVCMGLTDNYVRLKLDRYLPQGMILHARIDHLEDMHMCGTIIEKKV
jgi:threonylcarbamoyladenosine tRNA methylthiotransferase MtaB